MPTQPDSRRLTMWEKLSTRQPRTQRRWSAPVQPTASLIQPGYTDLGPRPPRPLRAPAYPLSSRPLLSQQTSVERNSFQNISSLQTSQQASPPQASPPQASYRRPRPRLWARVRRLSRLFRLSRHDHIPAQASPPTTPSPPSIITPMIPLGSASVVLEQPRPAPVPPQHPPTTASASRSNQTLLEASLPIPLPPNAHTPHAPANRRPLSLPPPLYGPDPTEAEHYSSPRPSLRLSQFALCQACARVKHCMVGLGGGRVLCTECLRQHLIDRQEQVERQSHRLLV